MGLLIAASSNPSLRPHLFGLALHPYVVVLVLLLPFTLRDLRTIPAHILALGVLFTALCALAMIDDPLFSSELVKLATAALTVLASALAVRNEKDLIAAVFALMIGTSIIAVAGFLTGTTSAETLAGMNFMEGIGDKNAFSLYALPAILLGGYLFSALALPWRSRLLLAVGTSFLALAIFMTANRSGWLGVFLIVVMLVGHRFRLRTALFATALLAIVYFLATRSDAAAMIENRIDQTRDGYSSDDLRKDLLTNAVAIGVENPALGVGPTRLAFQLARRTNAEMRVVDTHNVFGYIVGAFGLPASAVFVALTASLCLLSFRRRPSPLSRSAQTLTRMMIVLWVVRGMFSREILYAPTMCMGLGLAVGFYFLAERSARIAAARSTPPRRAWSPSAS
jgi:O-antigen ligase